MGLKLPRQGREREATDADVDSRTFKMIVCFFGFVLQLYSIHNEPVSALDLQARIES